MQLDADFYCYRNGKLVLIEADDNPDVNLAAADSWLVDEGRVRAGDHGPGPLGHDDGAGLPGRLQNQIDIERLETTYMHNPGGDIAGF